MNAATSEAKRRPARALPQVSAELHPEQRISVDAVCALVGYGRTKVFTDVAAGTFPQPERDGPKLVRWRAGDVLDWLHARRERLLRPESATPKPKADPNESKARAAARALQCKVLADLAPEERDAWEAAGRPGFVKLGRVALVTLRALQQLPKARAA